MKSKLILLLLIFIIINCINSEKNFNSTTNDPIQLSMDQNADSLLLDSKINAVSIGIYKDGKKYTAHYGELDRGMGNRPTDQIIYEIASVSKTFKGVLVANAVLEDKIQLGDDIGKYWKEDFQNFDYDGQPVTIGHLLTHTSGMPKLLPKSITELFSDFTESLPFKVHVF